MSGNKKQPPKKKPKPIHLDLANQDDLHPDAWERFEKGLKAIAKAKPANK